MACWGDHFDPAKGATDPTYCENQKRILEENKLNVYAISHHLAGQLVCDLNNDGRSDAFAPADCAGDAERKRAWAVETMKQTAIAAKNMGLKVVNGFTGSSIWHLIYSFPAVSEKQIEGGFKMKDAKVTLDGTSGILSSYLDFGQPGRGWDFRSLL